MNHFTNQQSRRNLMSRYVPLPGRTPMLSALAEDERLRIIKRTHEGRQVAQAKGVKMGRKPILTPHQSAEARQRLAKGETTRELAKSYSVSRSTISRLSV